MTAETHSRMTVAWIDGDVDGMVEEIRADFATNHAPYTYDTLSISDHARIYGYRWITAHLSTPFKNQAGRPDHARSRRACAAVMAAVDRIIDERMAELARREAGEAQS